MEYHKTTVKEEPVTPASVLPNTGTESSLLTYVIGAISLTLGGLVAKTKKEK